MTTLLTVLTILLMGILSVFGGFIFGVYMTLMYSPYDGTLRLIPGGESKLDISTVSPQKLTNNGRLFIKVILDDSQEKEPL